MLQVWEEEGLAIWDKVIFGLFLGKSGDNRESERS